jgi:hypothetical protein
MMLFLQQKSAEEITQVCTPYPPGRYTGERACFYQHVVPDGTPEKQLYVVYFAFLQEKRDRP